MRLLDLDKWKKKRPKKLVGLDVQEVSLVDNPANLIPLMIVKGEPIEKIIRHEGSKWVLYTRDGKKKLGTFDTKAEALAQERAIHARQARKESDEVVVNVEKVKADKLECSIATDFSVEGTKVKINGKKVDGICGINLSIYESIMENNMPGPKKVYFSYSTRKQVGDSEEYTNHMYSPAAQVEKETDMNKQLTKVLKNLFDDIPDGFDDLDENSQKELAENLSLVEEYVADMPPALREAIGKSLLVKAAKPDLKSIADVLDEAAKGIRSAMGAVDEGDKTGEDKDKKDEDKDGKDSKDVNINVNVSSKPEDAPKKEPDKPDVKPDDKKPEEVDLDEKEIEALAEEAVAGAMDEVLGGKT